MFQYAAVMGIAHRTQHTPAVVCDNVLASIYPYIAEKCIKLPGKLFRLFPKNNTLHLNEKHSSIYEKSLVEKAINASSKNIKIRGFFQTWKYSQHITDVIQNHFQFDANVTNYAKKYIQTVITRHKQNANVTGDVTTIGVHVRRGDFLSNASTKRGRSVATADYFHAAMNYFRKQYTNCVFLIASDDVKWCRKHLMAHDIIIIADHKPKTVLKLRMDGVSRDMSILRLVDHSIISTGTFSLWVGRFTPGQVIYFKNFVVKGSALDRDFKAEDYYQPGWIAM